MRYTKFVIENFKGIQNITIDLSAQPNNRIYTFVGLNESGKTTILEAINTVMTGYKKKTAQKLIPKHLKANFSNTVSVISYIEVDEDDNDRMLEKIKEMGYSAYKPINSFSIRATCSFENSIPQNIVSYWDFAPQVKKARAKDYVELAGKDTKDKKDDWHVLVDYIEDTLMPRIIYYEHFLFDFPSRIYLFGNKAEESNNKPYKEIFEDIIQEIIPGGSIEKSLYSNYTKEGDGYRDIFDAIHTKLEEYISSQVFASWGQLFNSSGANVVLKFGTESEKTDSANFYVEIKIKENSDTFFISERSVGFRWFFSFLFFILFRKNRKTDLGETLFLLDEPASNLHSTAQKRLLETFERFVQDEKRSLKLLYTTHSHHMINPKWLEGAYVVKNEAVDYSEPFGDRKVTNITAVPYKRFVADYPDQQDYFQPILDTLEYQPGLLEKVPNIIITEGKNDYYTLRYINEVLLKNKYKKIHLLPGAGCDKNHSIIQLYMGWNKSFMILLDADKAGKNAIKEYVSTFGNIILQNIKTYEDFVPEIGAVAMEDIFTEAEKLAITQRFDETATKYKKSAFNTAIQTALINKEIIELSEEALNKFDSLLKALNTYKFA